MALSPMRDRLVSIAHGNASDPAGFLEDLSDLHADWHDEYIQTYGFLLFHHRMARYFQSIVNAQLEPAIQAYAHDDLQEMEVETFDGDLSDVDALGELAQLSFAIRSWHNTAHARLQQATGTPMMDARQNIFFRPFWQLHLYVDDFFVQALQQYGEREHPGQFVNRAAIAGHLEARHHGWVPRI
ncbi:MAG: hypothetical protein M3O70_13475 [Actinomycetota bacterium]|nr:hypothetical protein [Actinomycetota bacterium]